MEFEQDNPKSVVLSSASVSEESHINLKHELKVENSETKVETIPTEPADNESINLVEHPPKRKLGSAAARLYARGLRNKEKKDII